MSKTDLHGLANLVVPDSRAVPTTATGLTRGSASTLYARTRLSPGHVIFRGKLSCAYRRSQNRRYGTRNNELASTLPLTVSPLKIVPLRSAEPCLGYASSGDPGDVPDGEKGRPPSRLADQASRGGPTRQHRQNSTSAPRFFPNPAKTRRRG